MSRYIDSERLIAEIERRKYEVFPTNDGKVRACSTPDQLQSGWLNALVWMMRLITSLQQEQQEEDLGNEIQLYLEAEGCGYGGWIDGWTDNDLKKLARHFYKLGLNSRKEK